MAATKTGPLPVASPMARAILGEREALPADWREESEPCFLPDWLGAKPHYADSHVHTCEGWMVWTYLPSGDPAWVADCPTYAEAHALALSLSAPTLWEADWLNGDFCAAERAGQMRLPLEAPHA